MCSATAQVFLFLPFYRPGQVYTRLKAVLAAKHPINPGFLQFSLNTNSRRKQMARPRIPRTRSEKKYLSYAYHRRREGVEPLTFDEWLNRLHSQGKDPEIHKAYFADDNSVSRKKYSRHKALARFRGIDFDITWEDWHGWWLSNGVDKNQHDPRRGADRLCMARRGDRGGYTLDNVYLATIAQNNSDAVANGVRRGGKSKG